MPEISLFKNATDTNSSQSLNIDDFIRRINEGYWQDAVLCVRTLKNKDEQDAAKKRLPMVTVSGLFSNGTRTDETITKHSGFIQIDLDKLDDVEDAKSYLYTDEYVYAGFVSCRGYGLCLIFRINPKKHRDAFYGISQYLYQKYKVIVDQSTVNESRGRFVSFDPHTHYNHNAPKFEIYPEKKKEPKQQNIIFTQSDFDLILQQIQNRKIDLTANYFDWLKIGFGIADKFSEQGRQYFHIVSENNPEYNYTTCDKQYDACLRQRTYSGSKASISSLYYYAKQAGISTLSEQTRQITQSASIAKKSGKDKETAEQIIKEHIGNTPQSKEVLDQVFDKDIQIRDEDSIINKLKLYLKQTYSIKRNEITRRIEVDNKIMDDIVFNSIWCDAVSVFEKVSADTLMRVLMSDFVLSYNPFADFFEKYKMRKPSGVIKEWFDCIESDAGTALGEFYPDYLEYFGTKWILSIIHSMHGFHSPLVLVLAGGQNTGKTEVWRRFLPNELQSYYAESKLDAGKDDEILMTQKLIIMDDEMGGKRNAESKHFKYLTSKQTFSLREPYGRANVDLKRLAVLCGTTNENEIIKDRTGNRRIIPIPVISIDYNKMNSIDRVDLFLEAYWMYKNLYDFQLSKEDIKILAGNTERFIDITIEQELIQKYFRQPIETEISYHLSATEIKIYIERNSLQKTQKGIIIQVMKLLGYEYYQRRFNGKNPWGYDVVRIEQQ